MSRLAIERFCVIWPESWRRLLTLDDGTTGDWEMELQLREVSNVEKLRIDRCVKFAVFLLVALFPLPWVWWNPPSEYGGRGTMTEDASAG